MCFGDRPEEEGARIQLRDILHCVMIILKPSWITHSDRSSGSRGAKPCIYSLHAHPDGRRLATGGLDTTVRIWNTEPILDEAAEADPNCHRLLCTMTRHNGAVLCVRWSNNDGRYLASSSDNDNVIIIWELDSDTSMMTTFGSLETNYENWRPLKYLRGHDSDVQDLAWSKDNQYLASCGVDGSVIIWDGVSFEKVTKIDQHGGFVKGITWDPVGKFLASQSDDKVLKIWRTSDWKVEQEIRGPFINAPGTTLFRRMSWSPNGSHIVTANAVNGVHCIAAIINRDEWTADVSLVGHQLPIEVASFNPKMFYMCEDPNGSSEEATKMLSTVCALGGQDRSVSIWVTRFSEPLCVAADIFNNSIYDISWSPDGQTLYACSQDGSVVCLKLEEELSDLVPDSEVEYQLSKYGSKDKALLPEAPVQLDLEDKNAVAKKAAASKRIANLMGDSSAEERPAAEADNQQQKAANGLHIGETSSGPTPPLQTVPENIAPVNNLTPSTPSDVALEQKVTIGKDGRKRITPVVIRSTTPAISMASSSFTQQNTETGPRPNATEYDLPVSLPVGGVSAAVVGTKRKPGSETTMDEEQITRRRPVWIDSGVVPPAVSHSRVKLGIPKVRASLVRKAEGDHIVMECRNPTSEHGSSATKEGLHNEFARVSATRRGQELWTDYLPSTVLQMAGDARHFVVSCEDGSIHVYSNAGRRVLPPLMMDSTPTILHCENNWLLCLTSTGLAYTWDLVNRKCCLSEVSIAPILQIASVNAEELKAAPSIKDVRIHTNGVPLIVTNYRQAFAYDIDMKVWLRVSDARYILSEFWTSSSVAPKTNPLGWLSNAMSRSQGLDPAGKSMMALINADKKASGIMTISYLEMQMAVAVLLDSPAEYQEFMMQYARRLAAENCQQKAQELCRWLAGPPFVNDETTGWEPTILGKLAKRELLKQVLPLLGSNRKLQRIVAEYSSLVS